MVKRILRRMLAMCPAAWYIFIRSIQLSVFLLLCALMLLIAWDGQLVENHKLYMTALSLREQTQALLLIGVLASVCIEDASL